ncbi:hypothetical protein ACUXJN_000782 [Staphylococcus capitis]|nr:hypothetical protein SEVCU116_0348 [Staphylococcus capitis VCU116]QQV93243.1 hypothetical protein [Staphylococcus virus vB_SepS_48]DAL54285.1 MAG TPA_asm: hypothetical protein [Caudoviricetes sp.]DAM78082.1 MAG TPA: hypothetical protein [Caudoviricetes sp.]DAY15382.1 MAG TPA: hypothetical protein [Caudoviricetes sp.]
MRRKRRIKKERHDKRMMIIALAGLIIQIISIIVTLLK